MAELSSGDDRDEFERLRVRHEIAMATKLLIEVAGGELSRDESALPIYGGQDSSSTAAVLCEALGRCVRPKKVHRFLTGAD